MAPHDLIRIFVTCLPHQHNLRYTIVGSIFFLSLLDEQELTSADTPLRQLKYSGQVHVRDLALMLEEILYFYRPAGLELSPAQLRRVLAAYDTWVIEHCVPLDPDVLQSVTAMISATAASDSEEASDATSSAVGFFQQHQLVKSMHYGKIAKEVQHSTGPTPLRVRASTAGTAGSVLQDSASKPSCRMRSKSSGCVAQFALKNESVRWCDIRNALDDASAEVNNAANGGKGNGDAKATKAHSRAVSMSVAARAAEKRFRQERMRIAHATVPFQPFARWLHGVLKHITDEQADEQAEESAH